MGVDTEIIYGYDWKIKLNLEMICDKQLLFRAIIRGCVDKCVTF